MYIKDKYLQEAAPKTNEQFGIKNKMQTPKIEKVVINMWIGSYLRWGSKDYSKLLEDLTLISWQKPVVRLAKKSVSNFKLREGMPVGLSVTLRWEKMYAFLEKLIHVVLPRSRDFRWVNKKSFDSSWNYNFWMSDHSIFTEVPHDDVVQPHGIQITIKMNTNDKEISKHLLTELWMPFSK